MISQPGYPYAPNSGQEFSAQDFYQNGRSAVAKLDDGNLVAVYSRYTEANDGSDLFAQVFNPDSGELLGGELELTDYGNFTAAGDFFDIQIFPTGGSEFSVGYRDIGVGPEFWMSASSDGSAERLQGIGLHPHYLNPGDNHMGLVWRSPEDPNIVVVLDEPGPDGGHIDYNSLQGILETFELKNGNYLAVYPSILPMSGEE